MSGWRQIVLLGFAATALRAHTSIIHVPKAPSQVEWTILGAVSNNWSVTVSVDSANCDIYCEIRRKPDAFGHIPAMDLLLPPAVVLQVFSGASEPITTIIDPAGRTIPLAQRAASYSSDPVCAPGKPGFAVSPAQQSLPVRPLVRRRATLATALVTPVERVLPLRI